MCRNSVVPDRNWKILSRIATPLTLHLVGSVNVLLHNFSSMDISAFTSLQVVLQGSAPSAHLFNLIFIALLVLIMYLFILRPQIKRSREHRALIQSLKVGDKVVTTGGIHGEIMRVHEDTVVIRSENSIFRVDKSAISLELTKQAYPATVNKKAEKSPSAGKQ